MTLLATIGLEMHCEMKSNAKVFSRGKNGYSEIPNSNVVALDLALPGTMPTINKYCVKNALKMSMILNCEQPEYMYFDRKNYYYPDLPKGFQITQFHHPVGINGNVVIEVNGERKSILIHDIHLEEDTASLDHGFASTYIDYNRCGIPLLELVTEPCIHSALEAVAFLEHMRSVYKYTDISEADTKKGQIRCDVNVSLAEEGAPLGTKVEIKNVNSFSNVAEAINYEIKRQSELIESGRQDEIEQETRRFDEESGTTIRMRSKADAIDYKYFVEPNIPKYKITKEWLENIRTEITELALERKDKYIQQYGLSDYDAGVLVKEREVSDYFESCIALGIDAKIAANWVTVQILAYINKYELTFDQFYLKPAMLKTIVDHINSGTISSKQAKEIFFKVLEQEREPENFISKENAQINDRSELEAIINEIIANNQKQVDDYHNGKSNLFDFFVGQVMKQTRGKANPVLTKEILNEKL